MFSFENPNFWNPYIDLSVLVKYIENKKQPSYLEEKKKNKLKCMFVSYNFLTIYDMKLNKEIKQILNTWWDAMYAYVKVNATEAIKYVYSFC